MATSRGNQSNSLGLFRWNKAKCKRRRSRCLTEKISHELIVCSFELMICLVAKTSESSISWKRSSTNERNRSGRTKRLGGERTFIGSFRIGIVRWSDSSEKKRVPIGICLEIDDFVQWNTSGRISTFWQIRIEIDRLTFLLISAVDRGGRNDRNKRKIFFVKNTLFWIVRRRWTRPGRLGRWQRIHFPSSRKSSLKNEEICLAVIELCREHFFLRSEVKSVIALFLLASKSFLLERNQSLFGRSWRKYSICLIEARRRWPRTFSSQKRFSLTRRFVSNSEINLRCRSVGRCHCWRIVFRLEEKEKRRFHSNEFCPT